MRAARSIVAGAVIAVAVACGGSDEAGTADGDATTLPAADPTATAPVTGSVPTTGTAPPTVPPTVPPTAPPTEVTFAPITTTVVGAAVGGSAGATGAESTDPFSEAVRNDDGTCSGWDGPGGAWTQGLESGAPVVFLARDSDAQIGTGTLGASRWEDVGADREQWNCVFPFEGTVEGEPEAFRVQVADLAPWLVRRDPTDPTRWIVSIDTVARFDVFDECTAPDPTATAVLDWDSFGVYWSRGIPQICDAGLSVVDIERTCRPPNVASEHIVLVTRADDPSTVLEDADGLRVDPAELEPFTPVVVHVATGRPCG